MIVLAPISVGELIDKITILEIKLDMITDQTKLNNVNSELKSLTDIRQQLNLPDIGNLEHQLKDINRELWDIEDFKRAMEKEKNFNEGFISAARWVYLKNDLRAGIKKQINVICGSDIIEEKSYS